MEMYELINHDIKCSCGRVHRCDIGAVEIGEGALEKLPEKVLKYRHVLLVADQNTYPLCGERVTKLLGGKMENSCIFHTEELLVPDEESIAQIEGYVTEQTDFILGIGSGVINDLCKYVSFEHGIKSGIIATATSMDGYASSGAAMILKGMKITFTTHAPDLIIGDVDILKDAPMDMIRSGYADIIGKYSALNDWKLSELINKEYLCPFVYDIVKEKTDEIRSLAGAMTRRDPEAIAKLMETLVLIGVCLTLLSTTRPGSGSEHHLSHFFEVTGLIEDKPYFLHGTDVGYATVVTAGLREKIKTLKKPTFYHISDTQRKACYQKIYQNHWEEVWNLQEEAGRYQMDLAPVYTTHWEEICKLMAECPTADEIREMLVEVGFDLSAFEKMYGAEKIQNGIWFGKDLKDRYSVLWLYDELFLNDEEVEKIL